MDKQSSEFAPRDEYEGRLFASLDAFDRLQEALVQHRISKGLSQTAVSDALGISQPMVSKIENAQSEIQLITLLNYAAALGVSISFKIDGAH